MKISKRFLTVLLTLVMLVGALTVAANAAEAYDFTVSGEGVTAVINGDNITITFAKPADKAGYEFLGWGLSADSTAPTFSGVTESTDLATFASWVGKDGGAVVLYPIWKKTASVPTTPLTPALPSNPTDTTKYELNIDYYVDYDYSYSYGCSYGCKYTCNHEYENWYDGDNNFGWCDTPWFDSSWDKNWDKNWGCDWDPRTCDNHYTYQSTCYYCNNGNKTNNGYKPNYKPNYSANTSVNLRGEGSYLAGQRISVSASSSFTYHGVKYYFAGWTGNGKFANRNTASTIFTMPARNTTIYAVYSAYGCNTNRCTPNHTHTVTYTDGVKGQTVFSDIVKTVRHNGTTPTVKDPTRPGYTFKGWSPKVSKNTTKCVVYEAQWSKAVAPKLTEDCVAYLKGYGKGQFGPEKNMTRGEFAVLLYRLLDDATLKAYKATENDFADVTANDWYNEAISTLANAAVVEATKNFRPKENITRAEMVAMLAAFYTDYNKGYDYSDLCNHKYNCGCYKTYTKYTTKYSCSYKDVPSTYWAYDQISLAQELGWIKGYGANTFLPDATITRAEVAAIINRVLDRDCDVKDTKNYTDVAKDAWYYADVLEATIAH